MRKPTVLGTKTENEVERENNGVAKEKNGAAKEKNGVAREKKEQRVVKAKKW